MADTSTLSQKAKNLLGQVRSIFGADNVIVTSARRPNIGNPNSQHIPGDAFDFKVKGMTNEQALAILANSNLKFKQLINEVSGPSMTGPHLHFGAGEGNQVAEIRGGNFKIINPASLDPSTTAGQIGGAINDAVGAVVDPIIGVVNDPLGSAISAISSDLVSRIVAVVLGIILIGIAIAAFNFSGKVSAVAGSIVKG